MDITLRLSRNYQRPVILLPDVFYGCSALLDTGSSFPMWTKGSRLLERIGGKPVRGLEDVTFSGFGGDCHAGIYKIDFRLGRLFYPDMSILCISDEEIPGYFLLSATMFPDMNYTINTKHHTFSIQTFDNQICILVEVYSKNGILHILTSCGSRETSLE